MENTKKILTKAVYGNQIKTFRTVVRIPAGELEKLKDVLGGMVNRAKILSTAIEEDDNKGIKIRVDAEFEVHIWYLSENDTKIYKIDVKSSDMIVIEKQGAEQFNHEDLSVWIKEKPKCVDAAIISEKEGGLVSVQLEYVLEAEIIGEAVLNVKVYYNNEAVELANIAKKKYLQNF